MVRLKGSTANSHHWRPKGEFVPIDKDRRHATIPKTASAHHCMSSPHLQRHFAHVTKTLERTAASKACLPSSDLEATRDSKEQLAANPSSQHVSSHVEMQLQKINALLKDASPERENHQAACGRSSTSTECDGSGAENSSDFEEWESTSLLPIPPPPPLPADLLMQQPTYSGAALPDEEERHWHRDRHWQAPQVQKSTHRERPLQAEAMLAAMLKGHSADWLARCVPRRKDLACVQECLQELNAVVEKLGRAWCVQPFGSYGNGLALTGSDLDAVCLTPESMAESAGGVSAVHILKDVLYPALRKHPRFEVTELILKARVPILKLRFADGLDVDLSCHNVKPIENTRLIHAYVQLDPKVRDLILAVKTWAKAAEVDPEIKLPCLPTTAFELKTAKPPGLLNPSWSCKMPVSILLARFFRFYTSQFQWGVHVVSVRLGQSVNRDDPRFSYLAFRSTSRIHIEDPFDLRRNLHCVLGCREESELQSAFREAFATVVSLGVPTSLPDNHRQWNVLQIISESDARYAKAGHGMRAPARSYDRIEGATSCVASTECDAQDETAMSATVCMGDERWNDAYDTCWWFCFIGGCCGYTLYAMYCGELFRLVIAVLGLVLVWATLDSGRKTGARRAELATAGARPRSRKRSIGKTEISEPMFRLPVQ